MPKKLRSVSVEEVRDRLGISPSRWALPRPTSRPTTAVRLSGRSRRWAGALRSCCSASRSPGHGRQRNRELSAAPIARLFPGARAGGEQSASSPRRPGRLAPGGPQPKADELAPLSAALRPDRSDQAASGRESPTSEPHPRIKRLESRAISTNGPRALVFLPISHRAAATNTAARVQLSRSLDDGRGAAGPDSRGKDVKRGMEVCCRLVPSC